MDDCDNCSETSGIPQCLDCVVGKFLNSTSCANCPANCDTCTNENTCTDCANLYYVNSTSGCSLCSVANPNWLTCDFNGSVP